MVLGARLEQVTLSCRPPALLAPGKSSSLLENSMRITSDDLSGWVLNFGALRTVCNIPAVRYQVTRLPRQLRRGLIHVGQLPLLEVDQLGDRCETHLRFDSSRIMFLAELLKDTRKRTWPAFE